MYSKNFIGDSGDIRVPPDYSGNAVTREPLPPPKDGMCGCPPPPPPPLPIKPGFFDKISTEDLLIFGAAALLVFRDDDDMLSLGLLLMLILF